MVEDFDWGDETSDDNDWEGVLIQFWEANSNTSEDSKKYWELTTQNKPFHGTGLSWYRKQSVCCTITVKDDDGGGGDYERNWRQILISRVFRKKRPETSCYARHKSAADNDDDASFGTGYCLYIPVYKTPGDYYFLYIPVYKTPGDYYSGGSPCGVMEYVSSCIQYFEKFMKYLIWTWSWSQAYQASDSNKEEYIHVRARRGQATNSHSLAERVRMKFLQDLVPGCRKVTGKAVMLDEIINYVQSLQRQVEYLSMKLATVNPRVDFNIEGLLAKDILQPRAGPSSSLGFHRDMSMPYAPMHLQNERVRRVKISERMKFLQDLVPGCSKVTGKAVMLDEIINFVQSLQRQVEILSIKLSTFNHRVNFNIEGLLAKDEMYMYGDHLYGFGRLNILEHAVLEMDQLLTVVCQKFPLPLAQYWVTTHPHTEPLRAMYQQSHTEMKNLNFLDKFKQACMEMRLNRDEGLVGTAYGSRKTFFCKNIKELSITNQHLAQYASYNMPIPCFIICLKGISPESRDCVLEFFLPPQEMIPYNHLKLLNSLLATMKDHLPSFMIASGERLGQVLKVEVIDSSMHNEPRFLKLGEWNSSLPHHEYEGLPLFEEDEHIVDIRSTTYSCNETATGETSEREPACHNIAETIHLDKLEEESSIKCIEPQSLTSKSKRSKEDLINEGNTEEIDQSAPETTLEVAIKHKDHTVAADTVDELVEEPPIVDIGHNMDVRYTMNTASQISNFEPTISFPQQVEEETMVLDTLAQNSRNILVTENDDTTIPVVDKTCQEGHTSKREIKPPEDISFASVEEHFGRPLDDVAASFGVSRSTLKRRCRDLGIKRWKAGKRTRSDNISSNLKRKINDEEPSRVSRSGMPSSQDTVVAHTSQHLNKMTVKATYNKVTIRFELSDLSGLAELEDNVIKRLHLEKKSFSIHYQDDVDEWMLISCDEDVQQCMEISRSSKKTTIKMKIDEPINNHHAP